MSNNKKIILLIIILVLILGGGSYIYFKKAQPVSQKITEKMEERNEDTQQQQVVEPYDITTSEICKDIAGEKKIENGKQYVIRLSSAHPSPAAYYNDYIFCQLFSRGTADETLLSKIKSDDAANFSEQVFRSEWFVKLESLNTIFKSNSCNAEEIDSAVKNYKRTVLSPKTKSAPTDLSNDMRSAVSENLEKVTSSNLCGFFKRDEKALETLGENFCADNLECLAMLKDDSSICDGYKFEDDKKMCSDNTWNLRALRKNDITVCSNIKSSHKNIACQAYFLDKNPNMCDAMANEIRSKYCQK